MKRAVVALMLMVLCLVAVDTEASAAAVPDGGAGATEEPAEEDECPRIPPSVWIACKAARAAGDGPGAIVGAIGQNVLDQLYEWVASAALWLLDRVLGFMQESTRPQVTAEWFGSQFGDMVTLASLLVVPLLLVAVISAMLRGRWVEAAKSALVYLPVAALGTAVAVPLVDSGIVVTDWMSDLFLAGMADDLTAFVVSVQEAMATPEGVAVGTSAGGFVAFLGALTIALGAFAIWVELVLRAAGIYVATFFLPLGFAGLVWPATRRWCGRLVKALAALILSKFVIVAAMALAASALGGASTEGFAAVVGGGAVMLMAAFSPLVLFRFADAVGDDMAASVAGTTMGRTSPVPTPAPQRTASQIYSRIMQERSSRDPSAPTSAAGGGPPDGKARDPAKNGGPAGGGARGGSAGQTPSTATPGSAGTANGAGSTAGAAKAATAGTAGAVATTVASAAGAGKRTGRAAGAALDRRVAGPDAGTPASAGRGGPREPDRAASPGPGVDGARGAGRAGPPRAPEVDAGEGGHASSVARPATSPPPEPASETRDALPTADPVRPGGWFEEEESGP